jgi:hypothetical protein
VDRHLSSAGAKEKKEPQEQKERCGALKGRIWRRLVRFLSLLFPASSFLTTHVVPRATTAYLAVTKGHSIVGRCDPDQLKFQARPSSQGAYSRAKERCQEIGTPWKSQKLSFIC